MGSGRAQDTQVLCEDDLPLLPFHYLNSFEELSVEVIRSQLDISSKLFSLNNLCHFMSF